VFAAVRKTMIIQLQKPVLIYMVKVAFILPECDYLFEAFGIKQPFRHNFAVIF
jgi:hypothetical protein